MSGRLIGVQIITTTGSGTYTPTAGTASIIFELQGGGAGGAGVASPSSAQVTVGGGGSGGGWLRKRLIANFSGAGYVVGAKGAGGTAGNNNGAAGSDSTFTDTAGSPTTYTAGGGIAGVNRTTNAPPQDGRISVGGSATNGDMNVPGGASLGSLVSSVSVGWSGAGGPSKYSQGAAPVLSAGTGTSTAGVNADGYGGGGSGAISTNAGGAKAGGDGSNGVLVIYEYD